jgi:hypothetical protein
VSRRSSAETAFLVGAPAALGLLELFHPHPHDLFQLSGRIEHAQREVMRPRAPSARKRC